MTLNTSPSEKLKLVRSKIQHWRRDKPYQRAKMTIDLVDQILELKSYFPQTLLCKELEISAELIHRHSNKIKIPKKCKIQPEFIQLIKPETATSQPCRFELHLPGGVVLKYL